MTTLLDHKTTLSYLAYLGYPREPRTSALQITRARKVDRRKGKVTRNVFLCYVCGAAGSGKTSLLRAFVGKPFKPLYEPTNKQISVVNAVDIDGSEKYLVVSNCYCLWILFNHRFVSFKSLGQNTRQKFYAIKRRRIWQTWLFLCTTRAIPIHSLTLVTYEYAATALLFPPDISLQKFV